MAVTKTANRAAEILRTAAGLVDGDREKEYGDFMVNTIRAGKEAGVAPLEAVDVMIGYKKARLIHSPMHQDSIVDLIAYYALREVVRMNVAEEINAVTRGVRDGHDE